MAWPALGGLALIALLTLAACAAGGGRGGIVSFDNAGFGTRAGSPGYIVDRGGSGAGA